MRTGFEKMPRDFGIILEYVEEETDHRTTLRPPPLDGAIPNRALPNSTRLSFASYAALK